jgi:quercetin dioxygenase-like cupin family protein
MAVCMAVRMAVCVPALACGRGAGSDERARAEAHDETRGETHGAMAAASGVVRADSGAAPRAPRFIPLGPMSGDVEILYGDPEVAGRPFAMRIRELAGGVIPLHSHPVDEHLTVLQGTFYFAVGDEWDASKLKALPAGSYAFVPAGTTMYGATPEAAVVQVHGTGPFDIRWRDGLTTLDDPDAGATFRFRKGDVVTGPRGSGRIRQGYASGEIVQYEIEGADGSHSMAHERDLRRP